MLKWYEKDDEHKDVVISSRIRLARNLSNYCFSSSLKDEDANKLVEDVKSVMTQLQAADPSRKYYGCDVNVLNEIDKSAMVEKHIISPIFASKNQRTGLILTEDESVSIMVNEEDHIRIQVIYGGMNLLKALEEANKMDDIINQQLPFAFDQTFGYLTSCPTNVGTGLRASYMLFLPALTADDKIGQLVEEVSKYGITIRGIYGENSKSLGCLYQVSNQKTLGFSETEIIDNLNRIVLQIIQQEKKRREYMISTNYDEIEDMVHRAYGILKYSKKLSTTEAETLLAQLKYGLDAGIIKLKKKVNMFQLMMAIRPCYLQWNLSKAVSKTMRDKIRAEFIRANLPELMQE